MLYITAGFVLWAVSALARNIETSDAACLDEYLRYLYNIIEKQHSSIFTLGCILIPFFSLF